MNKVVAAQQEIEQELLATCKAGKYTFMVPLVIQDPYRTAPLTALIMFDTPEASQITVHVPGNNPHSAVDFTFPGYQTHHEIPVYGLYAGTLNHITINMKMQNGTSAQNNIDLQTEPLPGGIPTFTIKKAIPDKYSPGFNFAFSNNKPVFDMDGNIRWYSTNTSFQVFTALKNGHFLFTYSAEWSDTYKIIMERDLLGKIYAIYNIMDGIHHDIFELPNGNLLVASSNPQSNQVMDTIIEVERKSGHIVRSFDMKDIFDPNRPFQLGMDKNDWFHLNSIFYDPADQTIIISSKAQSAVVKLTYPGMQIKWILGPHDNWSAKYQPYLLTPLGSNFEWAWSQHDATLYSPQIPGDDNINVLIFDNALYRSFKSTTAFPRSDWYSRVVHYRINESTMTIEQVWEYGQERGPELFSSILGGAYQLANQDVLGTWGSITKGAKGNPTVVRVANGTLEARIIEINPSTNEVVFEASVPLETYRTKRAGFYDGYSEKNAYLTATLNDTTGNDLFDRGVLAWQSIQRRIITPGLKWLQKVGISPS